MRAHPTRESELINPTYGSAIKTKDYVVKYPGERRARWHGIAFVDGQAQATPSNISKRSPNINKLTNCKNTALAKVILEVRSLQDMHNNRFE